MRKIAVFLGILLASISLSSCVKMDINLVVNRDATISGYTVFAFEKSLAEMSGGVSNSSAGNLINTKAQGVEVSPYNQGGFVGEKYTFTKVPFSEFANSKSEKDQLSFTRDGNRISVKGVLDLTTDQDGSSESAMGSALAKSIMASAQLDISIKFPGKVIQSTGTISEDGHTVTWKPVLGEKLDLATTIELPSPATFIMSLMGLALLASLGAATFLFTVKRKNEKSEA